MIADCSIGRRLGLLSLVIQPSKLLPSNNNFQPASRSAGVNRLSAAWTVTDTSVDKTTSRQRQMGSFMSKSLVVVGVETGGCPHTAIREDASINLAAISDLRTQFPGLDLILIESGGDNLAATFSPELADITIYVIDVSAGDDIPRKGGPGITRSDVLVINKTDLAPYVGADLDAMRKDTQRMRGDRPFVFTNMKTADGVPDIARELCRLGGLETKA